MKLDTGMSGLARAEQAGRREEVKGAGSEDRTLSESVRAQLRSKIRVGFNLHDQLFFCDAKHINTPAAAIPGLAGCGPYTKT
jgi:hypothetical protein